MKLLFNKTTLKLLSLVTLLMLFGYFILPLVLPILLSLCCALLLYPIVVALKKHIPNYPLNVTIVFTSFIVILVLLIWLTITQLINIIYRFVETLPSKINTLIDIWNDLSDRFENNVPTVIQNSINLEVNKFLTNLKHAFIDILSFENVTSFMSALPEFIIALVVFLVGLFLFLIEIPKIKLIAQDKLQKETYARMVQMYYKVKNASLGLIRAAIILSFITWIWTFIGLKIIGIPSAFILSIVICIIDVLPIVGATGVTIPWAIYTFIIGDTTTGIGLTILSLILLTQRKILEPKIVGNHVGLAPLPTLISMYVGLKLFGFVGFFIGPIFIILVMALLEIKGITFKPKTNPSQK
ncbi:sporulation integral membrane protein YtvI [Staphylococcus massiliensis]|uniref:sporulation integral membrane protein YtvI n=1 Tax=Staphylococcus massiliensis TaxID=555791 RepID=UPI001EDD15C8|nr:sporulation integral membrane protein YtvI [Staphylococcus massiliensis]MCG3400504.1 sporulation integral membrane protein YtvI [Staphylococcus massiliensis]